MTAEQIQAEISRLSHAIAHCMDYWKEQAMRRQRWEYERQLNNFK